MDCKAENLGSDKLLSSEEIRSSVMGAVEDFSQELSTSFVYLERDSR